MNIGPWPKGLGPQDHDDDGGGDHGDGPEPEGPEPRSDLEEDVMKVVMMVAHGREDNDQVTHDGDGYDL